MTKHIKLYVQNFHYEGEYPDPIDRIDSPVNIYKRKLRSVKENRKMKDQIIEDNRTSAVFGLAIYYSFPKTILLVCHCREYEVKKQILTIQNFYPFYQMPATEVSNLVDNFRKQVNENDAKHVFINKHYVAESLNRYTAYDLDNLEKDENYIPGIQDIHESLLLENRLKYPENFNVQDAFAQKALKIALLGFAKRLSGARNIFDCPVMNPFLPPDFLENYQQSASIKVW